jgi:hypothetical protein
MADDRQAHLAYGPVWAVSGKKLPPWCTLVYAVRLRDGAIATVAALGWAVIEPQ